MNLILKLVASDRDSKNTKAGGIMNSAIGYVDQSETMTLSL